MIRAIRWLIAAVLLACGLAATAASVRAQTEYPLWSPERISVAVGANYIWIAPTGLEPAPPFTHEWEGMGALSYVVVPRLAFTVQGGYGFDNRMLRVEPGARLRLTKQGDPVSYGLAASYVVYDATGDTAPPTFAKEWELGAYAAKGLTTVGRRGILAATGYAGYGMDDQRWLVRLGLRYGWTLNKEGW